MHSTIQHDRNEFKNKSMSINNVVNIQNTLYYNFLARNNKNKPKKSVQLHNLSTLNIIYYLEESFKLCDKFILGKLNIFEAELKKRIDLFDAILKFIVNSKVRSEPYYWIPGSKMDSVYKSNSVNNIRVDNIFSFISILMPDFVAKYKEYYILKTITGSEYLNCHDFIKQRYKNDYEQFKIMDKDLVIFEDCLSATYWLDNYSYTNDILCGNSINVDTKINIQGDLEGTLINELSFVDFNIGNKNFLVTLHNFEGLNLKLENTKLF